MKNRPLFYKRGREMLIVSVAEDISTVKIMYNKRYPVDYKLYKDEKGDYYFIFYNDKVYIT